MMWHGPKCRGVLKSPKTKETIPELMLVNTTSKLEKWERAVWKRLKKRGWWEKECFFGLSFPVEISKSLSDKKSCSYRFLQYLKQILRKNNMLQFFKWPPKPGFKRSYIIFSLTLFLFWQHILIYLLLFMNIQIWRVFLFFSSFFGMWDDSTKCFFPFGLLRKTPHGTLFARSTLVGKYLITILSENHLTLIFFSSIIREIFLENINHDL